ncbi:hypothetical protein [Tunturiibacter gelidiferens]|uniref:hypothetical protein n=1 Tax=Tunturiibacter gelidiferens TaxID=3069689 RepID=UPI003D9B5497
MTETERTELCKDIDPETILPSELKQLLSPSAQKLFQAIWFLMAVRDSESLFVDHRDMSQRSHVGLSNLQMVTKELLNAGLITVSSQRRGSVYKLHK